MLHEGVCASVQHVLAALSWCIRMGVMFVFQRLELNKRRAESPANTWLHAIVALFDALSYARTRAGKVFRFFHHYLSLFLISDIFRLTVSQINGVIDA